MPLSLLAELQAYRDFHRADWPAVENAVSLGLRDYDFYFDFLLREIRKLEPLWMVDPP